MGPGILEAQDMVALSFTKFLAAPAQQHEDEVIAPLGAVISLAPPAGVPAPPAVGAPPATCAKCGAYASVYARYSAAAGAWDCPFCGTATKSPPLPALASEAVDYRAPAGEARAAPAPRLVLVVDASAPPAHLAALKAAAAAALAAADGAAQVALLAFGASVAAYRLAGAPAGADAVHADVVPAAGARAAAAAALRPGVHLAPLAACRAQLDAALHSLTSLRQEGGPARPACLGAALDAALALLQQRPARPADPAPPAQAMERGDDGGGHAGGGHVVVLAAGAASHYSGGGAPGGAADDRAALGRAARLFERLAIAAAMQGVAVDVAAAAVEPACALPLSVLAQGSGGILALNAAPGAAFAANVAALLRRPAGLTASLEVRLSRGLAVRDTYGSVLPLYAAGKPTPQWRALVGSEKEGPRRWKDPQTWQFLASAPDPNQGVTVLLDASARAAAAARGGEAFLQVALLFTPPGGAPVHRVVTRRLAAAADAADVVASMQLPAAGIVWAKEAVAAAVTRGAAAERREGEVLRRRLGKRFAAFVAAHGERAPGGWFGGGRALLPPRHRPLGEALYHLSTGLLGQPPAARRAWPARELAQAAFLTAPLVPSARLLVPALLVVPRGAPAGAAPRRAVPADLALLGARAAVLDAGGALYAWAAGEGPAAAAALEGCLQLARGLAAGRLPAPDVVAAAEGSPEEAALVARLVPLRADSKAAAELSLPLPSPEARRAAARLPEAEEVSFVAWLRRYEVDVAGCEGCDAFVF